MSNEKTPWHVGQKAIINRTVIVTVDRITPKGRVIAGGRTFEADGIERSSHWSRAKLEPFTTEIQAEMDLIERGRRVSGEAYVAIQSAEKWLRRALSTWGGAVPEAADVGKAEKLTAAIQQLMDAGS